MPDLTLTRPGPRRLPRHHVGQNDLTLGAALLQNRCLRQLNRSLETLPLGYDIRIHLPQPLPTNRVNLVVGVSATVPPPPLSQARWLGQPVPLPAPHSLLAGCNYLSDIELKMMMPILMGMS